MKQKVSYLLFAMTLTSSHQCLSDKVITFFAKPYPQIQYNKSLEEAKEAQKLQKNGKIIRSLIKKRLRTAGSPGIIATYGGYLTTSNRFGQVSFPRRHQKPELYIVITKKIIPVLMTGNIIHHWEVAPGSDAEMYHAQKKQDPETELYYWEIAKTPVPKNNRIPLISILIFAKPHNVHLPTGITISNDDQNLILPTMYVKQAFNSAGNALYTLTIRSFFETPQKIYSETPYGYAQQLFTIG